MMDKVAILARVSTQRQDYERQVVELTDYCQRMNWEVVKVFANKVSGATRNANREEISGLVEYVKEHRLNRVVCLEISRLGRNTLEALKVINYLNENGASLHIKNYNLNTLNPDGKVNPVASLICTILLEIASMERLTIKERMESAGRDHGAFPSAELIPHEYLTQTRKHAPASVRPHSTGEHSSRTVEN